MSLALDWCISTTRSLLACMNANEMMPFESKRETII